MNDTEHDDVVVLDVEQDHVRTPIEHSKANALYEVMSHKAERRVGDLRQRADEMSSRLVEFLFAPLFEGLCQQRIDVIVRVVGDDECVPRHSGPAT